MRDAEEILATWNPNQKINYDRLLQQLIKDWQQEERRPKILLHSCCAPCSTYTLEYLTKFADVDIYFANSNIHPRIEYERRAMVQKQFVEDFNRDYEAEVHFIQAPYDPQDWMERMKGLEDEPEGGKRCEACFDLRLDTVAEKAADWGYDYFGSALTISPHKNSQLINRIGFDVQKLYAVNYLPSDFKKNNGYRRSVEMCETYDIYRQCYCGCLYAARDQGVDLKEVAKQAKEYVSENRHNITWNIHHVDQREE